MRHIGIIPLLFRALRPCFATQRLRAYNRVHTERIGMIEGLFQPTHLLILLVICLFIFGPKNLPALGKGMGQAMRNFKDGLHGNDEKK